MKPKIIIAIAMATLMVLLAFSSVIGEQQNSSNVSGTQTLNNVSVGKAIKTQALTIQELQALQEFEVYNILNYGIHSNNLSKLEYKANLNFISWYWTNYTQIPVSHREISKQNASVILSIWENNSPEAKADVQAVADYELAQNTVKNQLNTTYIVDNHLGTVVSIKNTYYNNKTTNLMTYEYTKNNNTLIYSLVNENGKFVPVDPYIRLNAFTIHWGWLGLISGTSYNIYFTFTNYNNALSFKNFLSSALTVEASVDTAMTIIGWVITGALAGSVVPALGTVVGAIVGLIGGIITVLQDNTNPTTVASTINGLFTNQEDYNGQFEIVYTLNAWESGLVPEFSWWGYYEPGNVLTQVYKNVGLASSAEGNFITVYNYLDGQYGTNVQTYFSAPSSWSIATYL